MGYARSSTLDSKNTVAAKIKDYLVLVKTRLTAMVVLSAMLGYTIGASTVELSGLLLIALGGFLVTASSNAINQILERNSDALMTRTANRPLVTGSMKVAEAIVAAGVFGVAGIVLLSFKFGALTGLIAALSLFSYAFIYTPLKKYSPIAVFVGAFPGAAPPLIGYVAATGTIDFLAILLFSLQFIWQFPHFWAIAWIAHEDYLKGGMNLLPNTGKTRSTAMLNVVYTALLLVLGFVPFLFGFIGSMGLLVVSLAGIIFLLQAVTLYIKCDDKSAKQLMFGSFIYLPVMLLAFWLDKI